MEKLDSKPFTTNILRVSRHDILPSLIHASLTQKITVTISVVDAEHQGRLRDALDVFCILSWNRDVHYD